MKKHTKTILGGVILLVVALIFIYPRLDQYMSKEDTSVSEVGTSTQRSQSPVNVVEVRSELLENNLNITGTVIPN
jgi:membrane fusion protein (multidrug efflux system)